MQDLNMRKNEQKQCCDTKEKLREAVKTQIENANAGICEENEDLLWETIVLFQGTPFHTAKGLEFTYSIKGYEMFVDRKDKSITKSTVALAYRTAIEIQREGKRVTGPKKLKTFGASYLYPLFIQFGVILEYVKDFQYEGGLGL